ncbi:MAG: hypothetical protein WAM14_21475 [Candidatus Nitrosopolaris sp.]
MANSKDDERFGVKYPKNLVKKAVVIVSNDESNNIKKNSQNIVGYVAQETEESIVVFSESNRNLRFDIPKSIISVAGNSVIIDSNEILSKYQLKRDDPLSQGKILGSSAEGQEGQITRQQPEPIGKREYYKTPVHATIQPTIEITKKSEAPIGRNGAERSFTNNTTMPAGQVEKEVVTLKTVDQDIVNEPLVTTGLDGKKEEQQELPVPDIGNRIDPSSGDHLYPFTVSMALWRDFALSGIHMYNEFARELSKINGNWINIFSNVWGESSDNDKKNENE